MWKSWSKIWCECLEINLSESQHIIVSNFHGEKSLTTSFGSSSTPEIAGRNASSGTIRTFRNRDACDEDTSVQKVLTKDRPDLASRGHVPDRICSASVAGNTDRAKRTPVAVVFVIEKGATRAPAVVSRPHLKGATPYTVNIISDDVLSYLTMRTYHCPRYRCYCPQTGNMPSPLLRRALQSQ
jgi:hypothetical protein